MEIKRPLLCSKVAAFYCWYFNLIAAHQQNQRPGGVREIGWKTFRFDNLNLIFISKVSSRVFFIYLDFIFNFITAYLTALF
jgi:hypothetical protein